ncbi:MAG: hypothetical protein GFH27_549287n259 [Chloroflexi bacterium AL-W]|nr:hypothetical protein [Chloroflexi bacterium AL-N1]NOK66533.1 hypothetical protein [Chloroflexi bacterium AL-N10]NOK71921.1 hypothetical protein [Chloroflexi bacterium AL-N5]NOK81178.1 hypothetical protein [Chloroflexi bacterium AL-W]NOK89451.1 hypothetical protein [Chloroflexi bacterium AL-N15]
MITMKNSMDYLDFTEEDLQCNRSGNLSPRQIAHFRKLAKIDDYILFTILTFFSIMVAVTLIIGLWLNIMDMFLFGLFATTFLGWQWSVSLARRPTVPYTIEQVQGSKEFCTIVDRSEDYSTTYLLQVQGCRFAIQKNAYDFLQSIDQAECIVYFTVFGREYILLSLEHKE